MTDDPSQQVPDPEPQELQFDHAEDVGPAAPKGPTCKACRSPISTRYYICETLIYCEPCRMKLKEPKFEGTPASRFTGAVVLGSIASVVGALIYFGVAAATGYEIGYVAIAVGFIVGWGVRKGSRASGGWPYQILAMSLTYLSIVMAYVFLVIQVIVNLPQPNAPGAPARRDVVDVPGDIPAFDVVLTSPGARVDDVVKVIKEAGLLSKPEALLIATYLTPPVRTAIYKEYAVRIVEDLNRAGAAAQIKPRPGRAQRIELVDANGRTIVCSPDGSITIGGNDEAGSGPEPPGSVIGLVIALVWIAMIAPFQGGASGVIGLLLIVIAIFEAWKMNTRAVINVQGPFFVKAKGAK